MRHAKASLAVAAVMLAAAALTGCGSISVGNANCTPNIQDPHQSNGSPQFMDAKMTMTCTATVTNAWLQIKMQQKANGSWRDVAGSGNRQDYGTVAANKKITIMTGGNLSCRNGTYRAGGKGGATYDGQPNQSGDWGYGNSVTVTCK